MVNHKSKQLAIKAAKIRAYRKPIPKYPKFYLSQGAVDEFEPIPARRNRKASIKAANTIQKILMPRLLKWLLTAANARTAAVTRTSPVICQA